MSNIHLITSILYLIVCNPGFEEESVIRLSRVGFENILGFLKGGFNTWKDSGRSVEYINRINSHKIHSYNDYKIIDVRNLFEYNNGKIKNSLNIPLFEINSNLNKLDRNGNYLIHCETGYRSMIALSLLKKNGFKSEKRIVE